MRLFKKIEGKKGIALIMALWIMTILLVVATSFAFMMRTEVKMAGNYRNGVKAHYLALAGVERAIATLTNDRFNDVDHLDEAWFTTFHEKIDGGKGWFDTSDEYCPKNFRPSSISFGGGTYAVDLSDENSKYNLNYPNRSGLHYLVATDAATNVEYQAKVCAIKDYVDLDSDPTTWDTPGSTGLEPQNKPFDTVYEIQKVEGSKYNINQGDAGIAQYDNPLDPPPTGHTRGQQSDMTVYSQDYNTQVGGSPRTEIKGASQATFRDVLGFTDEEAYSIAAVSGTFADHSYPWFDEPPTTEGVGAPGWATDGTEGNNTGLDDWVSKASMIKAADKMTCGTYSIYGSEDIIEGAVNINTATMYGLQTLFNIAKVRGRALIKTRQDETTCQGTDGEAGGSGAAADVILSSVPLPPYTGGARGTSYFHNRGEIIMVYDPSLPGSGIAKGYFQDFGDFVTVRSDRFRIYSIGKVGIDGNSDGDLEDSEDTVWAARKIEAVIDRGYHKDKTMGPITVLYWSEKVFGD